MLMLFIIICLAGFGVLGFKKPAITIIIAPLVGIAIFLYSYYVEENLVAASLSPLVFLAALISVSMSKTPPDSRGWSRSFARVILFSLSMLAVLIVSFGALGVFGFYMFVIFVVAVSAIAGCAITSRQALAAYVFSTIGSSIRQNLPLPMALECAACGQSDKRAFILRSIAKWLVRGYSLSESLKRGYPNCPSGALSLVTSGERIGQLPGTLKAVEADILTRAEEGKRIRPFHPSYPVVLLTFVLLIVLLLTKFVIPKFLDVMQEMIKQDALPASTRVLIGTANYIAYKDGWIIFVAGLLILTIVMWFAIYTRFRPRRPEQPFFTSRIGDFVKWHLPIVHWFEKNYSMVQVVESLRLSLNAGCPVNEAIRSTIGLDVNLCFKKRLSKWLAMVESGQDIASSALKCRLGNAIAWAFEQKSGPDSTLRILETLESFYRSNYSYMVNLAQYITGPCVVIMLGFVVGFVVYALFSPLVKIITLLSSFVTP
jgi:type IV pilus assembly protein PilC